MSQNKTVLTGEPCQKIENIFQQGQRFRYHGKRQPFYPWILFRHTVPGIYPAGQLRTLRPGTTPTATGPEVESLRGGQLP